MPSSAGAGNLNRQLQQLIHLEGPCGKPVLEGLALQILHGDEGLTFVLPEVVNRADIGMIEG